MVAILGGGISGLASAYYLLPRLAQHPHLRDKAISIFEASKRVGGWINSQQLPDGTVFEQGPHSIRASGAPAVNTLNLLDEIGLSDKVIADSNTAQAKLIYSNGRIHQVPNSLSSLFEKSTLLGKRPILLLLNDLTPTFGEPSDESVYDFVRKRFGPEIADKLICPMICGIFAGDAREISMKSFNKEIFQLQRKFGSLILGGSATVYVNIFKSLTKSKPKESIDPKSLRAKAMAEHWSMITLKGGIEQLPNRLSEIIKEKGVKIHTEHPCEKITFHKDEVHFVVNGETMKSDYIVSSLPAKRTAQLVEHQHPQLAGMLKEIKTISVAIVNLQFPAGILDSDAFGILVNPAENLPILGVIYDHCIYPQDSTVLTVMMGGAWFEKYLGKEPTNEHLLQVASDGLKKILGIKQLATAHNVSVLRDCIPQYRVGHNDLQERIAKYCREHSLPIGLCGSSYHGVGVNDVILSAKRIFDD